MTEPDVALTDYALAALCATFSTLALRWPAADAGLRRCWIVLFASIGLGSLLGGTVHGFFNNAASPGNAILWKATLLCIGVTAAAMWFTGAAISHPERGSRSALLIQRAAILALIVYACVVLFVTSKFLVAIAMYLPATIYLLVVFVREWLRAPHQRIMLGIVGLALTFVAAAVQQLRIALHPVYFNHNALYHVIQGVALVLLYMCARHLTTRQRAGSA
jgi:hypothetical protein